MYPASAGSSRQTGAPSVERSALSSGDSPCRLGDDISMAGSSRDRLDFALTAAAGSNAGGSRSEAVLSRGNRAPESTRVGRSSLLGRSRTGTPRHRCWIGLDPPLSRFDQLGRQRSGAPGVSGSRGGGACRLVRARPPLVGLQAATLSAWPATRLRDNRPARPGGLRGRLRIWSRRSHGPTPRNRHRQRFQVALGLLVVGTVQNESDVLVWVARDQRGGATHYVFEPRIARRTQVPARCRAAADALRPRPPQSSACLTLHPERVLIPRGERIDIARA